LRDSNRQQREAEIKRQRGTPETMSRIAQAARPKPLTNRELDPVTGEIHWPMLLTAADFGEQRAVLEKAFAARAYRGALNAEDFANSIRTIDEISAGLAERIKSLPPQEYTLAKRFLKSLAYEARMPVG
jgi:hypothetical protein